jgi:[acyl-carrier-protein] S-malonyltransferase
MGKDLYEHHPEAREIFQAADDALGFSLSRLCFDGPAEELKLTANTQPAILTCSVAAFRVLQRRGVQPSLVAGHSLGEYSALVAAGGLDFEDAARVTRKRGEWMQEAVPVGTGSMAAVLGLGEEDLVDICRSVRDWIVTPANFNDPGQIVIAGHKEGVALASERAMQRGAKRVIPLQVSAPFHCPLMKPAQEKLERLLGEIQFRDLQVPLVCNVDARRIRAGQEARECLIRQVSSPVRWTQSIELMLAGGVSSFLEVGPGRVLTALVKRISRTSNIACAGDVASIESLVSSPRGTT